jgi:hypothetical protein
LYRSKVEELIYGVKWAQIQKHIYFGIDFSIENFIYNAWHFFYRTYITSESTVLLNINDYEIAKRTIYQAKVLFRRYMTQTVT